MAEVVLRIRLVSGQPLDVSYEEPGARSTEELVDHVVSTFEDDAGVLRCRHGERLVAVYSRGVASVEVSPRGAIL